MTRQCALCDHEGHDVITRLARYPEGYATVDRCVDDDACRERLKARGEDWPLLTLEQARRLYVVGGSHASD